MSTGQNPLTQTQAPALDWSRDEAPSSTEFDDIYFSVDGGLEETENVFLKACDLPERWQTQKSFVIGELGFGSGLNFLASWARWQETAPKNAHLHFVSIEAFPWTAKDLQRALAQFPSLQTLAEELIRQWPGRVKGVHRLHFGNVHLTLFHMQAETALAQMDAKMDAWFLDGFSPAKNPGMWSQTIFDRLATLSNPGAKIGTFTVAGSVRRGLESAGFTVTKQPGFGRKRERLEAVLENSEPVRTQNRLAMPPIIIGGGIAGASLAKAFSRRGVKPILIEAERNLQSAASGNPAALVMPRLDLQDRPESRFFLDAYLYAAQQYAQTEYVFQTGALHLAKSPEEWTRFTKLEKQSPLSSAHMRLVSRDEAAKTLGFDIAHPHGGLYFPGAQTISPNGVISSWFSGAELRHVRIKSIERQGQFWACLSENGEVIAQSDQVFITAGADILDLDITQGMPVRFTRGQICWRDAEPVPACPVTYGGYALAYGKGVMLGATHDHVGPGQDAGLRPEDNVENCQVYEKMTGVRINPTDWRSRASVRVTTKDTLPISAQMSEGVYVMTGLGSRGFMMAPLLGEALVCDVLGEPSPLALDTKMRFGARENI